jgi:hypothetical protein
MSLVGGPLAIVLAALAAVNATARAASPITGPLGGGLAAVLIGLAVWLLRRFLGGGEAVAVATAGVMFCIMVIATWAGWRQRR